jgi:small subunit ribosomal protein S16
MGSSAGSPPGTSAAYQRNCWEKTTPVAVKIKLKRLGKIRAPYYRIVVADARTKRDGRAIEEIGKYHPKAEPSFIEVNSERAQHWLSVGAQPTDPVRKILEITGDWQKFKNLPGTEGTLKVAAPKEDRKEIFAAAVKETLGDAAPKGRGRSAAAGKDADSTEKAGRPAAKDSSAKAERPAKAKAGDQTAKASAGDGKAKDAGDTKASAGDAKAKNAGDAKAKDAGDAKAKDTGDTKAKAKDAGDAKAKDAGDTKAKAKSTTKAAKDAASDDADAAAAQAQEAEADPVAAVAESDSASEG